MAGDAGRGGLRHARAAVWAQRHGRILDVRLTGEVASGKNSLWMAHTHTHTHVGEVLLTDLSLATTNAFLRLRQSYAVVQIITRVARARRPHREQCVARRSTEGNSSAWSLDMQRRVFPPGRKRKRPPNFYLYKYYIYVAANDTLFGD